MNNTRTILHQIRHRRATQEVIALIDNALVILDEGHAWTKYYTGRTRLGVGTLPTTRDAVKFCVVGALIRASNASNREMEVRRLTMSLCAAVADMPLTVFNDMKQTRYKDVHNVLLAAKEACYAFRSDADNPLVSPATVNRYIEHDRREEARQGNRQVDRVA